MNPDNLQQLEGELQRLENALETATTNERRASVAVLIVSAAIAVVIFAFLYINYSHFKTEWTADKFQGSLHRELQELNPAAIKELEKLGEHLLPVYAAESRKQFDSIGPEIAKKLSGQLEKLGEDLQRDAHTKLAATEDRVDANVRETLLECFPDLHDDAHKERVTLSFEKTTHDAVTKAISQFDAKFSTDVATLRKHIAKLDLAPSDEADVDLQKRFISLWLKQLDREIQKL